MKRIAEHKCEGTNEYLEVCILGDKSAHPNEWILGADYNVQVKIKYCPFCGEKLSNP